MCYGTEDWKGHFTQKVKHRFFFPFFACNWVTGSFGGRREGVLIFIGTHLDKYDAIFTAPSAASWVMSHVQGACRTIHWASSRMCIGKPAVVPQEATARSHIQDASAGNNADTIKRDVNKSPFKEPLATTGGTLAFHRTLVEYDWNLGRGHVPRNASVYNGIVDITYGWSLYMINLLSFMFVSMQLSFSYLLKLYGDNTLGVCPLLYVFLQFDDI